MRVNVLVSPHEATNYEFAKVEVQSIDDGTIAVLDLDFGRIREHCREFFGSTLDFLFFSSIVYLVDKLIIREKAQDNWTRDLELDLPVSNVRLWFPLNRPLESSLSFLTGDNWRINFSQLQQQLIRPRRKIRGQRFFGRSFDADAVCLFSGGLDSLVGAIDWLESNPKGNLLLVSHYDGHIKGPHADQQSLFQILKTNYRQRLDSLQVRIGQNPAGEELSFRSRSLLFIALGIYAANAKGAKIPLLIPENGNIALNMPLTPSRRGACSTRTAHPFFLNTIRQILSGLGIENSLINPLEFKTKGECLDQCLNQEVLRGAALYSVSCAKHGHKIHWLDRQAKGCGFCMPCIFRRAALHKINLDLESYGRNICADQVDLDSPGEIGGDLRALISLLRKNPSHNEIASLLLANGHLDVARLPIYADLVSRALDEVRNFLRSKGSAALQRRAGI